MGKTFRQGGTERGYNAPGKSLRDKRSSKNYSKGDSNDYGKKTKKYGYNEGNGFGRR